MNLAATPRDLQIRAALPDDVETIAEYNCRLASETEDKQLDKATVQAGIGAMFGPHERGFYTVAVIGGRVVGTIMITYEWSDWRNGNIWWIQSVYVVPEFRRRGIFRALYNHIQAKARDSKGVCGLRLYVEQANDVAQQTYRKMGMDYAGYHVFERTF